MINNAKLFQYVVLVLYNMIWLLGDFLIFQSSDCDFQNFSFGTYDGFFVSTLIKPFRSNALPFLFVNPSILF